MATDDPRLSFDKAPESYELGRPQYPSQAFADLLAYLRARHPVVAPDVVEIGPGTGQATGTLLAGGAGVTAVEIGPRLAAVLRRKFASHPRLRVITAAFEDVELPEAAFDVVLAATSFRWLDPTVRVRKARDWLRPHGVLATLSTIQIRADVDRGFFDRTFPVYARYRPGEQPTAAPTEHDATPPEYDELRSSALLTDVELRRYRWDQTYSTGRYEHLVRSYSDTQMMAPDAREGLLAALRMIIDGEYGGVVVRPLVIALTLARRAD